MIALEAKSHQCVMNLYSKLELCTKYIDEMGRTTVHNHDHFLSITFTWLVGFIEECRKED